MHGPCLFLCDLQTSDVLGRKRAHTATVRSLSRETPYVGDFCHTSCCCLLLCQNCPLGSCGRFGSREFCATSGQCCVHQRETCLGFGMASHTGVADPRVVLPLKTCHSYRVWVLRWDGPLPLFPECHVRSPLFPLPSLASCVGTGGIAPVLFFRVAVRLTCCTPRAARFATPYREASPALPGSCVSIGKGREL